MIRLRVLGPIELHDGHGREIRSVIAQPKRLALLVSLVVGPKGFRRRDSLLALLWPELDETRGRAALNQAVRFLRKELGGSTDAVILSRGADEIGIDPSRVWCDVMELQDRMEGGQYSDALELYRGDLLQSFHGESSAGFQDWVARERELLRASAARAARELASMRENDQQYTPAVAAARRAVQLSEADERTVRELLLLLDRLGDRAGAVQAYDDFARRLLQDFDVEPAAETKVVIERIRTRVTPAERLVSRKPDGNGNTLRGPVSSSPDHDASRARVRAFASTWTSWLQRIVWLIVGAVAGAIITLWLMS